VNTPAGIPEADWALVRKICRKHGVDPLMIVAIGMAETHWFTKGDGLKGNGLGVGSYESGYTYKYAGVAGQVTRACEILVKRKVTTIVDILEGKLHSTGKWVDGKYVGGPGSVKWASADTADRGFPWSSNVVKIYKRLVKAL
jgi:hypothetical protein